MDVRPQIFVIAGPNGAGKTTFAREYLPREASCPRFVNADLIAAGLSPFAPDAAALPAARIMLQQIAAHAALGESFAFETTLSGRGWAQHIAKWRRAGFQVNLWFLGLRDAELAVMRVERRVREGGHHVPEEIIRRRFVAGRRNLEAVYKGLVDHWILYDNSGAVPSRIDEGPRGGTVSDDVTEPPGGLPEYPLFRAADAALRRAAAKAQERARELAEKDARDAAANEST